MRPALSLFLVFAFLAAFVFGTYTDGEARKILSDNGISVNKPHPATSLENVRKNTITKVVQLKSDSGCDIVVTAGTEGGHAKGTRSHGAGYKLDIRIRPCISDYIKKTFEKIGKRSDGAEQYKNRNGDIYALEGDHWDILFV